MGILFSYLNKPSKQSITEDEAKKQSEFFEAEVDKLTFEDLLELLLSKN